MSVRHALIALSLAVSPVALAAAPVPKEQLLQPPANADHFVVISEAGKHGDEWRWQLPDGGIAYRESILLRGLVFEQDEVIRFDNSGAPISVIVRGVTPSGDSAETFAIDQAIARWKTPADQGEAPSSQGAYLPFGGTFLANDALVRPLLSAGPGGLAMLPSGKATLTPSRTMSVTGPAGARAIRLHFLKGVNQTPTPVWLDEQGKLFGFYFGLGMLPAGYEGNLKAIIAAQEEAIAELSPATAKRFLTEDSKKPFVIRDVKLYDADNQRFVDHQQVVVADGKIVAVTSADKPWVGVSKIIDGKGKALVPGLWDSHSHLSDDFVAVSELALGVTSIRNPGGSIELAVSQRKRRGEGTLLAPEAFSSAIIDQKGPLAAQGSITVANLDETLAAVRRVKEAGLTGVKFYTSMNPAWIPPAAKLAHELGLHVHGHIPAGMRTLDAVNAGYDEITHIYFATMQAMPDEVVAKSNTTLRLLGPGKYFKDVDFNAEPTRTVIRTLAERKIVVDPTLVVVEGVLVAEAGKVAPAYTAYAGTLPVGTERSFKAGPLPYIEGMTREDAVASVKHMVEYVATMRKAGVRIVAGTDGYGMELVRELELYVEGGMTPAEALATATIVPAANVGADKRTGSIAVGKEADLLLVSGDPEKNIGDLRHVELVVLDGALLDGDALRKEAGFSGRPK
jgi:imidazolonepropionase-like amidohydrolase